MARKPFFLEYRKYTIIHFITHNKLKWQTMPVCHYFYLSLISFSSDSILLPYSLVQSYLNSSSGAFLKRISLATSERYRPLPRFSPPETCSSLSLNELYEIVAVFSSFFVLTSVTDTLSISLSSTLVLKASLTTFFTSSATLSFLLDI